MLTSPSFVTPLRYPGGKGRLGAWLAELIQHNNLQGGCYVEPYAGGAGAAMYLLANNHVDSIIINDIDPAIYAFWWAVLNDTSRFVKMILNTPVTIDSWHKQRSIILNKDQSDLTQLGFASFFLNRTNRSGIIKGGVIGGQKQNGKYKIDARYNNVGLADRVEKIGGMRDRICLFNEDAASLIKNCVGLNGNTLIYFDPPYFHKGSQLYRNHYQVSDHAEIASMVKELPIPWLVTYDNCVEIKNIYNDVDSVEFSLHYSTHKLRPVATEYMFYGNLDIHCFPFMRR